MMIDRITVNIESRSLTRSNGHITYVRDLSQEELSDCVYITEELFSRYKHNLPMHLRVELESFIAEEVFLLSCKFDGRGNRRKYLYFYGRIKIFDFHRSYKLHASRLHGSPETKMDDINDESEMLWDLERDTEDFSAKSIESQMSMLTPREKAITQDLMSGYTQMEIAKRHGLGRSTVVRDIDKVKNKLREYYGGNL